MMVPMTCLEGAYHYPSSDTKDYSSLAESLMRAVDKGAIASFSPIGFGVATGHDYLNKGLYEAIFSDDIYQVGQGIVAAGGHEVALGAIARVEDYRLLEHALRVDGAQRAFARRRSDR